MAATVRASWFGGAAGEPAGASAETGIAFNLADDQAGTGNPVTKPATTGTNFSWYKLLALEVTGTDATTLSNRTVRLSGAPTSGLKVHFQGQDTYTQPSGANKPADSGSDDATPGGYTTVTASPQVYHSTGASAGSTGRNGNFSQMVAGVDSTFAGGGGQAALPNIIISYDEA
jgi:hypothetical protein